MFIMTLFDLHLCTLAFTCLLSCPQKVTPKTACSSCLVELTQLLCSVQVESGGAPVPPYSRKVGNQKQDASCGVCEPMDTLGDDEVPVIPAR